jgi:hypothetical protein
MPTKMLLELLRIKKGEINNIIDEDLLRFDSIESLEDCIDFIYDPREIHIKEVIR